MALLKKAHKYACEFEDIPFITVAQVDGICLNSCLEFLFLCDLVYATKSSVFGVDEKFIPLFGGIQRAVRDLGLSRAKKLFFMGDVGAEELQGFIARIFEDREEMEKFVSGEVLPKVLKLSQTAQVMTKRIINASVDLSLEAGLSLEREMFSFAFGTEDKREGIRAFFEKREPKFLRRECHEL